MKNLIKWYGVYFLAALVFVSCSKDDDNAPEPDTNTDPVITDPVTDPVNLDNEINEFVFKGIDLWYLWENEVPEFVNNYFDDQDDFYTYLNSYSDPEDLFYNGILVDKDRFSWIVEDYDKLFNSFSGVSTSNGLDFGLQAAPEGLPKVVGFVRYVIPGSDAAGKDINRGDFFYAVNGIDLYYNSSNDNNLDLLDSDNYTLNMADIDVNTFTTVPNDKSVELSKTELSENPIHISKTIDVNGTKIGYLMYNQFVRDYDEQLNDVFGQFKADGITDLVLDLRYNPGGSVSSAIKLASMITGQFTGQLFSKESWNKNLNASFSYENNFIEKLSNEGPTINSLNLNRVYIIALDGSASASELVINGLAPYIDVIHIGDKTVGKNEFSVTLVDNPVQKDYPPYIYVGDQSLIGVDRDHKYAMQPLVGTNENAAGFSEFTEGLVPDIEMLEILTMLGELGNPEERLLAKAIEEITGVSTKKEFKEISEKLNIETLKSSTDYTLTKDNMYWDLFEKYN